MTRFRAALLAGLLALSRAVSADVWSAGGLVKDAERRQDVSLKTERLGKLMAERHLGGVLLTKWRNHAWALSGSDTRIVQAQTESPVWLLYLRDGTRALLSNNIEAGRLMAEEGLTSLGFQERRFPWFAGAGGVDERWRIAQEMASGATLGCDAALPGTVSIAADLARIRFPLTTVEMRRYRWLGSRAAGAVADTCREIAPGMRETEIAGRLGAKLWALAIVPSVVLVGVDERLASWRHLTPTAAALKSTALVNLCAERWGLVVAVTRLVHFGRLPDETERRMRAVAAVDAAYLRAARPGTALRDVFRRGAEAYAAAGFPEEWRNHHQGGPIAYFERETLIGPDAEGVVVEGMALALNPTIAGVKVEDTFLVGPRGAEMLTATPGWPMRKAVVDGFTYERPDILVRPPPPVGPREAGAAAAPLLKR